MKHWHSQKRNIHSPISDRTRFCDPVSIALTTMAVSGGVQAYGQVQQGKAQSAQYRYQAGVTAQKIAQEKALTEKNIALTKRTAEQNRIMTSIEAAEESKTQARKATELKGTQKAAMGKMGISGVTAEDIVGTTFDKAKLDQLAIQYNADLKSWGTNEEMKNRIWGLRNQSKMDIWALEEEKKSYGYASKYAKKAGYLSATNTLLGTAASMALAGLKYGTPGLNYTP